MITKKILFIVASKGYQPIEYGIPKKLLEQAGFSVVTASDTTGTAIAADETITPIDLNVRDVVIDDYDGVFFVGGPGALEHLDRPEAHHIITATVEAGKPIGAICIATRILAHAGVLTGKQATGWNGDGELPDIYQEYGVNYVPKEVIVDDNIITATGPNAAREYGEQIITMLQETSGWE